MISRYRSFVVFDGYTNPVRMECVHPLNELAKRQKLMDPDGNFMY